jgi:hypothetical protein
MISVTRIVISYGCAQQRNGVLRLTFPSPKNLMGLSQKAELRCNSRGLFRQLLLAPAAPIAIPSLAGTHRPVRIGAAVRTEPEQNEQTCRQLPRRDRCPPAILAERAQAQVRGALVFKHCVGNQTDRLELQQY